MRYKLLVTLRITLSSASVFVRLIYIFVFVLIVASEFPRVKLLWIKMSSWKSDKPNEMFTTSAKKVVDAFGTKDTLTHALTHMNIIHI